MKCKKEQMLLYAVTDRAWAKEQTLSAQVEAALKGDATCVQLREKRLSREEILREAKEIGALCRRYGVPFLLNDDVELALVCGADGVHVGQEDMQVERARALLGPDKIIGVSAHTVEEAVKAVQNGADYLGVGAAFATATKSNAHVLPEGMLSKICRAVDVPVVAIGGITAENILQLSGTGISGAALVSAIFSAKDITGECQRLRAMLESVVRG